MLYVAGTAAVKFSVLCLYQRLFGALRYIRVAMWIIGTFVACYSLVEGLIVVFRCRPVTAGWDMSVEGSCVNIALGGIIIGAFNVATDVATLLLPVRAVWRLQIARKWKMQICGIFLLGGL